MKTLDEWLQKYATTTKVEFDLLDLIKAVRKEAFERCELEASKDDRLLGREIATLIAKVYQEEGEK